MSIACRTENRSRAFDPAFADKTPGANDDPRQRRKPPGDRSPRNHIIATACEIITHLCATRQGLSLRSRRHFSFLPVSLRNSPLTPTRFWKESSASTIRKFRPMAKPSRSVFRRLISPQTRARERASGPSRSTAVVRRTRSPDLAERPRWSPDGKRIYYTGMQGGVSQILERQSGWRPLTQADHASFHRSRERAGFATTREISRHHKRCLSGMPRRG